MHYSGLAILPALFGPAGFNKLRMLPRHSSFPSPALWTLQAFSVSLLQFISSVCQGCSGAPSASKKGLSLIFLNIASQSLRSTQIQITKWRIQLECFEIQFSRKAVRVYNLLSAISKIHYLLDFRFPSEFLLSQYPVQGGSSTWKQGS